MIIGGIDASIHTQPPATIPYNNAHQDVVSQSLTEIKIGDTLIHTNAGWVMHDLIIDSGSSGSLIDQKTYSHIIAKIASTCAGIGDQCWLDPESNSKCVELDDISLLNNFPDISFVFSGQSVLWHPDQYLAMEDQEYPTYLCFGADVPPEGNSYLLGSRFMLEKDIVFGESNLQIYP